MNNQIAGISQYTMHKALERKRGFNETVKRFIEENFYIVDELITEARNNPEYSGVCDLVWDEIALKLHDVLLTQKSVKKVKVCEMVEQMRVMIVECIMKKVPDDEYIYLGHLSRDDFFALSENAEEDALATIGNHGLASAMASLLTVRQQRILNLRFFHGMTYVEVAGELGISVTTVRSDEGNALRRMRHSVTNRELEG